MDRLIIKGIDYGTVGLVREMLAAKLITKEQARGYEDYYYCWVGSLNQPRFNINRSAVIPSIML